MCGIFGFVSLESQEKSEVRDLTNQLFRLSESRGKEASGLTIVPSGQRENLFVVRSPQSASTLIHSGEYRSLFDSALGAESHRGSGMALFGHTRLVTNGSQARPENNQPVVYDGGVIVHNGIVVNVDELWSKHSDLTRFSEVDSEIIVALARKFQKAGASPAGAVRQAFGEIKGTASVAITFNDLDVLILATNNGSLYVAKGERGGKIYFASEYFILKQLVESLGAEMAARYTIAQIPPQEALLVHLGNLQTYPFRLEEKGAEASSAGSDAVPASAPRSIVTKYVGKGKSDSLPSVGKVSVPPDLEKAFERSLGAAAQLKRCTRCVMTETVPFIAFDKAGVCNFCRQYKKIELKGRKAFEDLIAPYRKTNGRPDCVAALSGGRDSCYGLHFMVKELGLKPITYTYDWGMVTDLARRNISRVCSKLGIENIIISADITKKRENIRKNVLAWLDKPHLGMIPLFMAGDKQFVWYSQRIKKQNEVELDIFTFNLLEKTQFKEEYTGAQMWTPGEDSDQLGEKLRFMSRLKLASFYGTQFLTNPGYMNRSLFDTFWGYVAYYFLPQTFVGLFQYIPWIEDEVVGLLRNEFDWELATDTKSSWRIGDGTAAFYNYIYLVMGGFTENDTLRSNQIREGHLDRATALELTYRDNAARWESLKWYCDIIGIDMVAALRKIHQGPKQHPVLEG
jgi:glutamine---fructose-6-phosphate transaminase (isomerizing)